MLAIIIGAIIFLLFKNSPQLKRDKDELVGKQQSSASIPQRSLSRWKLAFYHAASIQANTLL
jgi:hypothetical protein